MAAIDLEHLESAPDGSSGEDRWAMLAEHVASWAVVRRIALRDTIVLVPFAQLLAHARSAFGRIGAWLPRIETTQTLARSLGPPVRAQALQLSLDHASDLLTASQLLEGQGWGRDWSRRDPRGFARAASAVVDTAHALLRAGAAMPPVRRTAYWQRARTALAPVSGPGGTERLLARVALEWAALGVDAATDRLFALRPAAWVVLQAGGPDALASALLDEAPEGTGCLVIDSDPPPDRLFAHLICARAPSLAVCDSFEHEAQAAAAQVIRHVQRGEHPVALIAQDRVLVRRVRALLEQAGLTLLDETGWTLSTTRAAGQVMALLRAAIDGAGTDVLFAWLKGIEAWPGEPDFGARVAALEGACRRQQIGRVDALERLTAEPAQAAFGANVLALLRRLPAAASMGVADWLGRLADALGRSGTLAALQGDEAGRQVLSALRLEASASARAEWLQVAGPCPLGLDDFVAWVDAVFERATYRAASGTQASAQVVVTPLAQAIWRPFAALVLPGADDRHLGAAPAPHPLIADTLLRGLGLRDVSEQRSTEALAFSQALWVTPATLLRRRLDGHDPLADSPLVERLRLELRQRGADLASWDDPRVTLTLATAPQDRPAPTAPGLLPALLSASAAEALRACPYRFFALHLLRLREDEELEGEVEKRDYGNWLHEVLRDFHAERVAPAARSDEMQRLFTFGIASRQRRGLDEAEFLPFDASFAAFVPRYIDWLHARDAAGARWREAERELTLPLTDVSDVSLRGIIDRIDSVRSGPDTATELIDYKTGSASGLRDKLREPFEDTQLAFYAALLAQPDGPPLRAMYLALDGSRGLEEIRHPNVERSADALVHGLTDDLRRLRGGAGMPALGEGQTCEYCQARGLCRRDHWTREALP